MVAIYSDPQGDSVFDRADAATTSATYSSNDVLNSDDSLDKDKTIESLKRRIAQLESTSVQNKAPGSWLNVFMSSCLLL